MAGIKSFFKLFLLPAVVLCLGGINAHAQCSDPWVTQAVRQAKGAALNGTGAAGDCNPNNYGGGHWSSYPDLLAKVQAYFHPAATTKSAPVAVAVICSDPWVTQAVMGLNGRVNGSGVTGDCNPRNYGGGQWSSYPDLQAKVNNYFHPAPIQPASITQAAAPTSVRLLVGANQCIGVEGGSYAQGARLIRWSCTNAPDQLFRFMPDGTLRTYSGQGLCVDDKGGMGNLNDSIDAWACNGNRGQQWRLQNYNLKSGLNGACLGIRGGYFLGNADALLTACSGTANETYINYGQDVPANGRQAVVSGGGRLQQNMPIALTAGGSSGTGIVAQGGGNIVAQGGGNIVAQGGGNIVAQGGGN